MCFKPLIKNMKFLIFLFIIFLDPAWIMEAQTRRALLVGINNYEPKEVPKSQCRKEWWNLFGCINDVDAMKAIMISPQYGFKPGNIYVLKNEQATRERILSDFKKYLIDNTSAGDICVFYYSGHGSRVNNSMSDEPDKMDETLVPADWYRGVGDIRDKELKKLYNRVLDKQAHLTVIVDACHSGSGSRGIPVRMRNRSLPPNECDVTEPPDGEKSPAERGALIFSAAQDFQAAVETTDENNHSHGLFTWALLKVLKNRHGTGSAQNILLKVKAIMQSEGKYQEPNLEGLPGKTKNSIWGAQADRLAGPLKVAVSRIHKQLIELEGGLAVGIRKDCELKKADDKEGNPEVRVRVTTVHGLSRCTAKVIQGQAEKINVGDLFELDKWVASREARMKVRIPVSHHSHNHLTGIAGKIAELRESPDIDWVEDPTVISPTHIISWHQSQWRLENLTGSGNSIMKLGENPLKDEILEEVLKNHPHPNLKPRIFLQLPLSIQLHRTIRMDINDYNHSIEISSSKENIHYILVGRYINKKLLQGVQGDGFLEKSPPGRRKQEIQYAWVLPNMTQAEGQDFGLPTRTGWIALEESEIRFQKLAEKLTDKILQLVRIRAWLQLSSPPDNGCFPYYLALKNAESGEITTTGPLSKGEIYGLVLKAVETRLKSLERVENRYVYVFSIDSTGKGTLLFPDRITGNIENYFPIVPGVLENEALKQKFFRGSRGAIFQKSPPGEIELGNKQSFKIKEPFGVETFILLTTTDAISHPWVLNFEGIRREKPAGRLTPFEELLYDLSSVSRNERNRPLPINWSIQRLSILSKAKQR